MNLIGRSCFFVCLLCAFSLTLAVLTRINQPTFIPLRQAVIPPTKSDALSKPLAYDTNAKYILLLQLATQEGEQVVLAAQLGTAQKWLNLKESNNQNNKNLKFMFALLSHILPLKKVAISSQLISELNHNFRCDTLIELLFICSPNCTSGVEPVELRFAANV